MGVAFLAEGEALEADALGCGQFRAYVVVFQKYAVVACGGIFILLVEGGTPSVRRVFQPSGSGHGLAEDGHQCEASDLELVEAGEAVDGGMGVFVADCLPAVMVAVGAVGRGSELGHSEGHGGRGVDEPAAVDCADVGVDVGGEIFTGACGQAECCEQDCELFHGGDLCVETDGSAEDGAGLALGRADAVGTDGGRNDKGFGVVDGEGGETAVRALYDGFFAFDEVEHMDAAGVFMADRDGEFETAGLDEFVGMESCADLLPAGSFGNGLEVVGQMFVDVGGVAFPLDYLFAAVDVDRARFAVEAEPAPVPKLESEDVGRRAYFQHYAACTRAVDCAAGDEEMVVLCGGKAVDVFFSVEYDFAALCGAKVAEHLLGALTLAETQVDRRTGLGVKDVVALVLGVGHAELLADKLGRRMDLEAEVAAADGVEKVEADREILAEAGLDRLAEDGAAMLENQVVGRQLEQNAFDFQQEAVFLRHAVEAPAVVRHFGVEPADVLHPLASPRGGVEERNDAERPGRSLFQSAQEGLSGNELGVAGGIGVEPPVHAVDNLVFIVVEHAPVDEEAALVLD